MSPADEIEYTIKEIAAHKNDAVSTSYKITSFPEIRLAKLPFYYMVEIFKDCRENDEIIKRYEELINEIETRKITIENQIVDVNRKIALRGIGLSKYVPIYYKNCVFTYHYTLIGTNCVNCIVVKG